MMQQRSMPERWSNSHVQLRRLFLLGFFVLGTNAFFSPFLVNRPIHRPNERTTIRQGCPTTSSRTNGLPLSLKSVQPQSSSLYESSSTTTNHDDSPPSPPMDEIQRMKEKAAKLRQEIAQLEGKSVQQVAMEAKTKRELEQQRQAQADRTRQERRQQQQQVIPLERNQHQSLQQEGRWMVQVPYNADDMVRQAARAVERAFADGKTRQTVRFHLIREDQRISEDNEWPGGAQQMYREAAKPLTNELLRQIYAPTKTAENTTSPSTELRFPPTVKSQDIWDFDGSALHSAEAKSGSHGDVQALVFPNTDVKYIKDIESISKAMGPRLFLLVNPFWRNVESWGFNLLAPGAKQLAQSIIFDNGGYEETYVCLSFSVRGENCVAIKAYPYDWQLFAYLEDTEYGSDMESVIRLGSSEVYPTSKLVTELLNARPEFKQTKTMRQMKNTFGKM